MPTVNFEYELGLEVEDIISGVKGIINARSQWINGCIRYSLQPKASKTDPSKMPEGYWLDEEQIKVLNKHVVMKKRNTGGPTTISPRM